MALLSWTICIATFLGGLAALTDLSHALSSPISWGLFMASFLCCPPLWQQSLLTNILNGRQRAMACLALLLMLPLVLLPAA